MGSVAEPRYCAVGDKCVWFARDGEPAKLSDSNPGDLCESCRRAGASPTVPASDHAAEFSNSAPSQELEPLNVLRRADKYCPLCGNFWDDLRTWGQILSTQDNDQPWYFCEECAAVMRRGGTMTPLFLWEIGSAVPLEERFNGLFRAARALLEEDAHEDRVLPTLAVEGLEIHEGRDQEPWSQEAADFYANHPRVRLVRFEDGILILERREADVEVALEGDTVVVSIAPRPKPPAPTEVALAYERAMTSWGKPFDIEYRFSSDVEEKDFILHLRFAPIQPVSRERGHQVNYPSPERVSDIYRGLLGGNLGKRLETRPRGSEPTNIDNLVAAIVAFYLRTYGGLQDRIKVHKLLNEHVLCERSWELPEYGGTDTPVRQLWDGVDRFHKHLVREMLAL